MNIYQYTDIFLINYRLIFLKVNSELRLGFELGYGLDLEVVFREGFEFWLDLGQN